MKFITNILLILSLVCYAFLPFYEISFQGSLTGLEFTAGTISKEAAGWASILFALLPFLCGFIAIMFNCLKNWRWGFLVVAAIAVSLFFYFDAYHIHEVALEHAPEVHLIDNLGEGFSITGMGIGFKCSLVLLVLALVSAILSMFPFSFNRTLDERVDRLESDARKEWDRMRHKGSVES